MASQMSCPLKKSSVPFYGIKWKQEIIYQMIFSLQMHYYGQ